jgi:type II secretory pathway component PulF
MSIPESMAKASSIFDDELAVICRRAGPRMFAGSEMFRALEPDRMRFPELTIPVLEVGEVSGTLDEAAFRLADAFARMSGFDRKFKDVKIEPIKIVVGVILFKLVFGGGDDPVKVGLSALYAALEAIAVIFVLRTLHRNLYRWPRLHRLVDKIHLAIPHVGGIERCVASARWARSFATMWHAGVPISQALEVASRSTLNAYYEFVLMRAAEMTRQGKSLKESLDTVELLPKHLLPILNVGHESAHFTEALDHYVDALEDEAILKAQQETGAAMVALHLIMGFIALMIAFASLAGGR